MIVAENATGWGISNPMNIGVGVPTAQVPGYSIPVLLGVTAVTLLGVAMIVRKKRLAYKK